MMFRNRAQIHWPSPLWNVVANIDVERMRSISSTSGALSALDKRTRMALRTSCPASWLIDDVDGAVDQRAGACLPSARGDEGNVALAACPLEGRGNAAEPAPTL